MLGFGQGAFVTLTASPTHQLVVVVLWARSFKRQEKCQHIFVTINKNENNIRQNFKMTAKT